MEINLKESKTSNAFLCKFYFFLIFIYFFFFFFFFLVF